MPRHYGPSLATSSRSTRAREYWLYRYKKYTDVRLVFAPEQQMAFFGGDPDNFTYPRYDLDFAIFRVYENDAAGRSPINYLQWNAKGAADSELVFVSGHPGIDRSRRHASPSSKPQRDVIYPISMKVVRRRLAVLRDVLERWRGAGAAGNGDLRARERAKGVHRRIQRAARPEDDGEEGGRRTNPCASDRQEAVNGSTRTAARGTTSQRAQEVRRGRYKSRDVSPSFAARRSRASA